MDLISSMNAENLLLTHFSARYPKMPPSSFATPRKSENSRQREPVLALAFDHANIAIKNLWKMNFYMPAIEQSFRDTAEEGDQDEDVATMLEVDAT